MKMILSDYEIQISLNDTSASLQYNDGSEVTTAMKGWDKMHVYMGLQKHGLVYGNITVKETTASQGYYSLVNIWCLVLMGPKIQWLWQLWQWLWQLWWLWQYATSIYHTYFVWLVLRIGLTSSL